MFTKIRHYATLDNALPVLAIVIALSWVWSTVGVLQHNFQYQRQVDELHQQVALLKLKDQSGKYRLAYYGTDEYSELAARQNLGLAQPGESELIVPPSRDEQSETSFALNGTPTTPLPPKSNFQQWTYFLFGKHHRS